MQQSADPIEARTCGFVAAAVVVLSMVAGSAAGQALRADARVSVDSTRIGERFALTLQVRRPEDATVRFPSAEADPAVFGDLDVLGRETVQTRRPVSNRAVDRLTYDVTTFALDSAQVPALPIRLVVDGDTTVAATPPRTVRVSSVLRAEATGLREGELLAPFPHPLWTWIAWTGVVAAVLVAGFLGWRYRERVRAGEGDDATTDDDTSPYEAASQQLRELRELDLTRPSEVESFYVVLSDVVRSYLAHRLGVATQERTTREVVKALEDRPDTPPSATDQIQAVLHEADLVKFAGTRPPPSTAAAALRKARAALADVEDAAAESQPIDAVVGAAPSDPPQ